VGLDCQEDPPLRFPRLLPGGHSAIHGGTLPVDD
jgi:hypothetical protein